MTREEAIELIARLLWGGPIIAGQIVDALVERGVLVLK